MSLLHKGLFRDLEGAGLGRWRTTLEPMLRERLSDEAHGKIPGWRRAVESLPEIEVTAVELDRDAVVVHGADCGPDTLETLRAGLMALTPWRKGPFEIFGIRVDAEWRSDLKWRRVADTITPLAGRAVLDVGSGNGYYALRMKGQKARLVLGIDPSPLCVAQFAAIQKYAQQDSVHVLPLRLQDLPELATPFDTVFSMGVLYHRREPLAHLADLRRTLRSGGELLLETLILPGSERDLLIPDDRYARMRNVWHLPSLPQLEAWLTEAGFRDCRIADVTVTTAQEQRSTDWMPFESLDKALDPDDPTRTTEGLPAPTRAVVICHR